MSARVVATRGAYVGIAYRGMLLATSAMVLRNAGLLLILAPVALLGASGAFAMMMLASCALVLASYGRGGRPRAAGQVPEIQLGLPFSLPLALKYGLVFLVLHIVGGLTQARKSTALNSSP